MAYAPLVDGYPIVHPVGVIRQEAVGGRIVRNQRNVPPGEAEVLPVIGIGITGFLPQNILQVGTEYKFHRLELVGLAAQQCQQVFALGHHSRFILSLGQRPLLTSL